MKPNSKNLARAVLYAVFAPAICMRDVAAEINTQELQRVRAAAANLSTVMWEKAETGQGSCKVTKADGASRKVWIAKLSCTGGGYPSAGFYLPVLRTTMALPGAKITAKIQVTDVRGPAVFFVGPQQSGGGNPSWARREITSSGTYTLTTDPFNVQANQDYKAGVRLQFEDNCQAGCVAEGKILELKWEF